MDIEPNFFITNEVSHSIKKNWKPVAVVLVIFILLAIATQYRKEIMANPWLRRNKIIPEQLLQKLDLQPKVEPKIVQKVDRKTKSGEFLIQDPVIKKNITTPTVNKWIVVRGMIKLADKKVTADVFTESVYLPSGSIPVSPSSSWIRIEMISENQTTFQTLFPIDFQSKQDELPFKIYLPYNSNFLLKIYDKQGKLLFSKEIKL